MQVQEAVHVQLIVPCTAPPPPLVDCHPPLPLTPAADLTVVDRNARNTMLVVKSGQIYVIEELQKNECACLRVILCMYDAE